MCGKPELNQEKISFLTQLKAFSESLSRSITLDNEWTIRGFIDVFKNVYSFPHDTKVLSKILELHLLPNLLHFAAESNYKIELPKHQNWYPDLTFIHTDNHEIKFAVDIKTTYRDNNQVDYCNGFTLGSHGEYFVNRKSTKNIQYPYDSYLGHFCLGVIYSRPSLENNCELSIFSVDEVALIPSVIRDLTFFAEEKWRIASDKAGSGNTANIGSIKHIKDIVTGNGVFARAGEKLFDDYWANYGKIEILNPQTGVRKKLTSFHEYLSFRGLPDDLYNAGTGAV